MLTRNNDNATDSFLEVFEALARTPSQRWRWRLKHVNGKVVYGSTEGYSDRDEAIRLAVKANFGNGYNWELRFPRRRLR